MGSYQIDWNEFTEHFTKNHSQTPWPPMFATEEAKAQFMCGEHEWKDYTGVTERYKFCVKCDVKEGA